MKDTGIGIPAEILSAVFDPFTQLARSLGRAQGGLGVGLALVKRLVEMHGGTVTAASDGPGRGSEFVVRLPISEATAQPVPEHAIDAERAAMDALRVLVADDNRDSADSASVLLSLAGHETRVAYDGLEPLEVAAAFRPDVIVLELDMPNVDGFEACCRIREQPWAAATRIIALSGWGQEEDVLKSERAGFDGHLVKPVDYAALEQALAVVPPLTVPPGAPPARRQAIRAPRRRPACSSAHRTRRRARGCAPGAG